MRFSRAASRPKAFKSGSVNEPNENASNDVRVAIIHDANVGLSMFLFGWKRVRTIQVCQPDQGAIPVLQVAESSLLHAQRSFHGGVLLLPL